MDTGRVEEEVAVRLALFAGVLALFALVPAAQAGYGSEDPRLEELYGTFVPPCCWRDNLTIHESGIADELRVRIKEMVVAGRSDDEIKQALVAEYGARILIVPEGPARGWLFWTPWFLAALGLAFVVYYLRRLRHPAVALALEGATDAREGK